MWLGGTQHSGSPAVSQQLPKVAGVGLVSLGVPLAAASRRGVGRLADMRGNAGRGHSPGDIPPPRAPLQRERDVVQAAELHQPGPQVRAISRGDWPRLTSPVAVSR